MKLQEKYLESIRTDYKLSRIEVIIITFLHNNPAHDTARDIVEFRMLQRGNVSTAIDSLTDKGYLTRHPDTNDKRIIHLKLSDRSIPVIHAIEKVFQMTKRRILLPITSVCMTTCYHI